MTPVESVAVTAQATFGRDGAMFEGLLGFVAQLSLVLWSVVVFTVIVRFVGIRMYRHSAARAARARTAAPSAALPAITLSTAVPVITAVLDVVQPAASHPAAAQLAGGRSAGAAGLVDVLQTDAVTNGTFEEVLQPALAPVAAASSLKAPRRMSRMWRSGPRSAAHVPALATNSTEG
jgi:hypothetical protein